MFEYFIVTLVCVKMTVRSTHAMQVLKHATCVKVHITNIVHSYVRHFTIQLRIQALALSHMGFECDLGIIAQATGKVIARVIASAIFDCCECNF